MQSIIARVKEILLDPKGAWPRIEAEPATTTSLYNPYLLVMAGVSAVATFISLSLIGVGGMGMTVRLPIASGLAQMVIGFALTLVIVYVMSLVANALAPSFGGQKSAISALKLMVYGSTASLLGTVFTLLPFGSLLALLAALYSLYLLYTGLPVLMKNPPGKTLVYLLVLIVCGFVLGMAAAGVTSLFSPSPVALASNSGEDTMTITTPAGELKIDTARMDEMARQMEAAGKQMEEAQKSGDGAAAAAAAGAAAASAMAAITGSSRREAVSAAELRALLPETAAGLARESFEVQSNSAMGFGMSEAKARYGKGAQRLNLSITDAGALGGLASLAGWANLTTDRENDTEVERIGKQGQRTVREMYLKDGSRAEFTVILANGILVEAKGDGVSAAEVKKVLDAMDLARLETMAGPAK